MRNIRTGRAVAVLLAALLAGSACGNASSPAGRGLQAIADRQPMADNVVVDWNGIALHATATGPYDPPRESRTLAMVQGAVLDAVALTGGRSPAAVAAVAAAAHDVLVAVYPPPQRPALDDAERVTLEGVPDGPDEASGVDAGRRAAGDMLARRAGDHADEPETYEPEPAVGVWRPTPPAQAPALDPNWARVTPFVLRRPSQFRLRAPYALASQAYARDFAELKAVGSKDSTVRTPALHRRIDVQAGGPSRRSPYRPPTFKKRSECEGSRPLASAGFRPDPRQRACYP